MHPCIYRNNFCHSLEPKRWSPKGGWTPRIHDALDYLPPFVNLTPKIGEPKLILTPPFSYRVKTMQKYLSVYSWPICKRVYTRAIRLNVKSDSLSYRYIWVLLYYHSMLLLILLFKNFYTPPCWLYLGIKMSRFLEYTTPTSGGQLHFMVSDVALEWSSHLTD